MAALLTVTSLRVGWRVDDHSHRLLLGGPRTLPGIDAVPGSKLMTMFTFFNGDPRRTGQERDIGVVPWWTDINIRGAFCRPVTAVTHWLDYRLWPQSAALMHLHSVIWYAALAFLTAVLFRNIFSVGGLVAWAALLYAIDDRHGTTVGFLANRNAVVAAVFGVLTLLAHDAWRRRGWTVGALLGPIALGLCLFSAEAGIAVMGYLIAYAMFLDPGTPLRRWSAILPYAVVIVPWRATWSALGYGVSPGMALYVDPAAEPVRYIAHLLTQGPFLLLGQWIASADIGMLTSTFYPQFVAPLLLATVVVMTQLALVVVPKIWHLSAARFCLVGMCLALFPACAATASDRNLVFVGIGAAGVLATFVTVVRGKREAGDAKPTRPAWTARAVAGVLLVIHVVVAPAMLAIRAGYPFGPPRWIERCDKAIPLDEAVQHQTVVIVKAPIAMIAGIMPLHQMLAGLPAPRYTRVLSPTFANVTLIRESADSVVVRPERGYLALVFDRLFRPAGSVLRLGEKIQLPGMSATIVERTLDSRPAAVRFRFDVPLEDASLRWLQWDETAGTYVPFPLPPIGVEIGL